MVSEIERLASIEGKLDLMLKSHEERINRLENGLVGLGVSLLLTVFAGLFGVYLTRK